MGAVFLFDRKFPFLSNKKRLCVLALGEVVAGATALDAKCAPGHILFHTYLCERKILPDGNVYE